MPAAFHQQGTTFAQHQELRGQNSPQCPHLFYRCIAHPRGAQVHGAFQFYQVVFGVSALEGDGHSPQGFLMLTRFMFMMSQLLHLWFVEIPDPTRSYSVHMENICCWRGKRGGVLWFLVRLSISLGITMPVLFRNAA